MKKDRIFGGIAFVISGIFLIVSKLGYFPGVNIFSLLLTAFFVIVIVKSVIHVNFIGILFPSAFISIIYDKQLGITNITPWTVLIAALLGSIGLSMIFHKENKWINRKDDYENYKFEEINIEDENHIRFKTSFGASIKYINTDSFEEGDFSCSFASLKVYFDNAIMHNHSAIVRINASCSGIELYIPKTWKVDNQTNAFLSGVSEKNSSDKLPTNSLVLVGDINLSGIEIVYI